MLRSFSHPFFLGYVAAIDKQWKEQQGCDYNISADTDDNHGCGVLVGAQHGSGKQMT
jgi:hypothetical protein